MQYADVATWGELKALRKIMERQGRQLNAVLEWLDGDTKRRWMLDQEGRKVLARLTFEKGAQVEEEESRG